MVKSKSAARLPQRRLQLFAEPELGSADFSVWFRLQGHPLHRPKHVNHCIQNVRISWWMAR